MYSKLPASFVEQARKDCAKFTVENYELLNRAGDPWQNGSDFWYTRNGHGVGFWDRGYPDDVADPLTEACKTFGERIALANTTKKIRARWQSLMPGGTPKYVRCYDNGGPEAGGSIDRYTVVFTGNYQRNLWEDGKLTEPVPNSYPGNTRKRPLSYQYVGMNCAPFHPQGFGQHGESDRQIDVSKWGFAPAIGRKNHLGLRIRFEDLPEDCRKLVVRDYKEIWGL